MAVNFNVEENGYSIEEVNKYIEMLQQEYENAVAWGEEMEAKYIALKADFENQGVCFTITEENQNEVIRDVFDKLTLTIEKVKADAQARANDIVERAKEDAAAILRRAKENSVEIRTENITIMKNLKSIGDMIDVILEKGIQ